MPLPGYLFDPKESTKYRPRNNFKKRRAPHIAGALPCQIHLIIQCQCYRRAPFAAGSVAFFTTFLPLLALQSWYATSIGAATAIDE